MIANSVAVDAKRLSFRIEFFLLECGAYLCLLMIVLIHWIVVSNVFDAWDDVVPFQQYVDVVMKVEVV